MVLPWKMHPIIEIASLLHFELLQNLLQAKWCFFSSSFGFQLSALLIGITNLMPFGSKHGNYNGAPLLSYHLCDRWQIDSLASSAMCKHFDGNVKQAAKFFPSQSRSSSCWKITQSSSFCDSGMKASTFLASPCQASSENSLIIQAVFLMEH